MGGSIRVNVIVYKDERESFDDWLTSWKWPGEGRFHRKTRFEKSAVKRRQNIREDWRTGAAITAHVIVCIVSLGGARQAAGAE
jgi:hypothetical protein